jgi:hypothetical protein
VVPALQGVVINEIQFDPPDNTLREEFIELHNPTQVSVDLSHWRLSSAVDYFFPAGTSLAPGGYLVVAENPAVILARHGVAALGPWTGRLNNEEDQVTLRDAADKTVDSVDYRSQFPWPIHSNGEGGSMQLVNPGLDNDLGSSWRALAAGAPQALVTPGAANSVLSDNAPPNIRQVNHTPEEPTASQPVAITAKVTDPEGVRSVKLRFQVVAPGAYMPSRLPLTTAQLNSLNNNPNLTPSPNPAFEDPANWTEVIMVDDGTGGDAEAGDGFYSVTLPQRPNRTLVRYRIVVEDEFGAARRAPFEDDPALNFAYYVYNGVPDYEGHAAANLTGMPVYTLISRSSDVDLCTAYNGGDQLPQTIGNLSNEGRFAFNWGGTLVYDGRVYDHIRYRLRGANGRYQPGKRNWRFDFNKGSYFQARDQFGTAYPRKWSKLNTGKGQSNRQTLTFGLNEVINYALWTMAGVPSPSAHWFHFRVVDGAAEAPEKYGGDFWGLNWAQENYDVRFLESRRQSHHRHRCGSAPNVGDSILQARLSSPLGHLRWTRHHGIRATGCHRR